MKWFNRSGIMATSLETMTAGVLTSKQVSGLFECIVP